MTSRGKGNKRGTEEQTHFHGHSNRAEISIKNVKQRTERISKSDRVIIGVVSDNMHDCLSVCLLQLTTKSSLIFDGNNQV